jgi:hypothetical protein
MHVTHIAKEETYIVKFISTQLLILKFPGQSSQSGKSYTQLGCIHFYIYQVVSDSDSQILVFYSKERRITLSGNATNWNSSGCYEAYYPDRKIRVNFLTKSVMESP